MKTSTKNELFTLFSSAALLPCMEELASILIHCRKEKNHALALQLHSLVCKFGLGVHKSMGNYLVSMLAVTGHIQDAHRVFKTLTYLDEWSWYSLIDGYIDFEKPEIALSLYEEMDSYVHLSGHAFVALVKACTKLNDLGRGIAIHLEMARRGLLQDNPFVGSALVDMYAKCASLTKAQRVFDNISLKDVVSWTAIMAGFAEQGHGEEALMYYEWMQKEGVPPNATTFLSSLKACGCLRAIAKGREIHDEMEQRGLLEGDDILYSALVDMYAKCGALVTAQHMFDELQSRDIVAWTTLISGYADHGHGKEALECYEEMQGQGVVPNVATLVCVLKACGTCCALEEGQETHIVVEKLGIFGTDPVVGYALVDMYTKCRSLDVACMLFDDLPLRNVVPWTSIIGGYAEHGYAEASLNLLKLMHIEGIVPNAITHICALKACSQLKDLIKGQEIHAEVERHGLSQNDMAVGNSLIDFYAKCGLLDKAYELCVRLPASSIVSWNALLTGYVEWGYGQEAMSCFEQIESQDVYPDHVTFLCILRACGSVAAVDKGQEIHATVERLGLMERDQLIGGAVVDFYAKCGLLATASHMFGMLSIPDVFAWTALIAGHAECGDYEVALELSEQMQFKGMTPNPVTLVCLLKCCGNLGHAHKGQEIHGEVERLGLLKSDIDVGDMLVFMYAKCGSLVKAREVLERIPLQTIVTWNELLLGYADHGHGEEALKCFEQMQLGGIAPDLATLVSILEACEHERIHADSPYVEVELTRDGFARSTLVSMYLTCGVPPVAQDVFEKLPIQDVHSWNTLISCYLRHGKAEVALACYDLMQLQGISPNAGTLVHTLSACGRASMAHLSKVWADIERLSLLHSEIERVGWLKRNHLIGCALVHTYTKCGFLGLAQEVFDELPVQDVVSWDALIAGYTDSEHDEEALRCIDEMQTKGVSLSPFTFLHGLQACVSNGAIEEAQKIHVEIQRQGLLEGHLFLGNKLVDVYAKCGLLTQARDVFDMLQLQNVVSWNMLILGYLGHGCGEEAVKLLGCMQREGISPDPITWLCSLKSCASVGAKAKVQEIHVGIQKGPPSSENPFVGQALLNLSATGDSLVKAQKMFKELNARSVVLWNVLVSTFANLGLADEAVNCLEQMTLKGIPPSAVTYVCMLMSCASFGAVEKGQEVHAEIERQGLLDMLIVGNALVNMYAKSGFLTRAKQVCESLPGRDVISWTTMMAGYAQVGEGHHAFSCFGWMLEGGIKPDAAAFVVLLSACNCMVLFAEGQRYVEAMAEHFSVQSLRHQTCLVDLLCQTGQVDRLSTMVTERLLPPGSAAWRVVLRACRNWGSLDLGQEAFKCTVHMADDAVDFAYAYEDAEPWVAGLGM